MKNLTIKTLLPTASFATSFVIAAVAAYLLVSHFQHTILQAWSSTPLISETDETAAVTTPSQEQTADQGCGCPSCCAVSYVR